MHPFYTVDLHYINYKYLEATTALHFTLMKVFIIGPHNKKFQSPVFDRSVLQLSGILTRVDSFEDILVCVETSTHTPMRHRLRLLVYVHYCLSEFLAHYNN